MSRLLDEVLEAHGGKIDSPWNPLQRAYVNGYAFRDVGSARFIAFNAPYIALVSAFFLSGRAIVIVSTPPARLVLTSDVMAMSP